MVANFCGQRSIHILAGGRLLLVVEKTSQIRGVWLILINLEDRLYFKHRVMWRELLFVFVSSLEVIRIKRLSQPFFPRTWREYLSPNQVQRLILNISNSATLSLPINRKTLIFRCYFLSMRKALYYVFVFLICVFK